MNEADFNDRIKLNYLYFEISIASKLILIVYTILMGFEGYFIIQALGGLFSLNLLSVRWA